MILTGVNQKGILLGDQAEELGWKGRQDACEWLRSAGTAIKRKMPAWSKRYGKSEKMGSVNRNVN